MDHNSKPLPVNEFTLEELDNELLLYHPTKTTTVYMNETASIIWRLCDGKRTVGDIIRLIEESYPEAAPGIEEDVESTLNLFIEHGAVSL